MARKRAWWKKISIKSISSAAGKLYNIARGAIAGSQQAPAQITVTAPPIVAPPQGIDKNTLLVIGGIAAAVLILVVVMKD